MELLDLKKYIKQEPYYESNNVILYNNDCIDILSQLPEKSIDLCLTDPPYGVNFEYESYEDTPENLISLISNFMPLVLKISKTVLLTCGIKNMFEYPKPKWILSWVSTAGAGCNPYGFSCWQPILFYGENPYLKNRKGSRPDIILSNETSENFGHSCTKPINLWKDVLKKGSIFESDIIIDPFSGSGTTGVSGLSLGRKCILVEKTRKYCDISIERLKRQEGIRPVLTKKIGYLF